MVPGSKSRWKSGGAAQAKQDPLSRLYQEIREWSPMEAYFAQECVLVAASPEQASILSRACFGQAILSAPASSTAGSRDAHLPARPPRILAVEAKSEGVIFQLGLEEAFFLAYDLRCLRICYSSPEGPAALSYDELWSRLQQQEPLFLQRYLGFRYLRERHWVVRSGHQYGAHFLAYRHHPELVHSEYAILIVPEGEVQQRVSTWTEIHGNNRLYGSVSKILLLLHVVPNAVAKNSVAGLKDYFVEAVQVQRWLPEENRSGAAANVSSEAVNCSALHTEVVINRANLLEGREIVPRIMSPLIPTACRYIIACHPSRHLVTELTGLLKGEPWNWSKTNKNQKDLPPTVRCTNDKKTVHPTVASGYSHRRVPQEKDPTGKRENENQNGLAG